MNIVGEKVEFSVVFRADLEGSIFVFNIITYIFVVLENAESFHRCHFSFLIVQSRTSLFGGNPRPLGHRALIFTMEVKGHKLNLHLSLLSL